MSITNYKTNLDFPRSVTQGDNFDCEATVNANLTGFKCRVTIYDNESNEIHLATANVTGGADTEVLITAGTTSTIKIYVDKDLTDVFGKDSYLEIEIEDTNEKVFTILNHKFKMNEEKTTWTSS